MNIWVKIGLDLYLYCYKATLYLSDTGDHLGSTRESVEAVIVLS